MENDKNNGENVPTLDHAKEDLKSAATLAAGAVSEAAGAVAMHADHARQAAAGRFSQAREFAASKVNQIRRVAGVQAAQIRAYASEKASIVRQKAGEGWGETCDKAKELHRSGEEYVKANPTKSVLIALGTGIVLGFLLRRR